MATAQLLTLTHGVDDKVTRIDDEVKCVDGKVKDIGDTVRVVHDGARCVIFSYPFLRDVYVVRRKGNKINRTADGKRNDSNYATYGEQGRRSRAFVLPQP